MLLRHLLIILSLSMLLSAYTVLTHQAVIDAVWGDTFEPALRRRFRAATPEELRMAHAFAHGGCIIQDIGYQPLW